MVDEAGLLTSDTPVRHHDEIRDTHHIEPLGQSRRPFRIDFQHDSLARHLRCGLLYLGRGHSAGTAPRSPEVDQHRNTGS